MAKLTNSMLEIIRQEAEAVEFGSINIKLNAAAGSVDIAVTKDIRVLKDDPESSKAGRVVVHSQRREG